MSRLVQGADRRQQLLLPECLDDYVAEDNPVRVVDVFVDELDLSGLGFDGMTPAANPGRRVSSAKPSSASWLAPRLKGSCAPASHCTA